MAGAIWKSYKGHEIRWVYGGRGGEYELYVDGDPTFIRCRKLVKGWVIEHYRKYANQWDRVFDEYFKTRSQAMNKTVRIEVESWLE